MRRMVILTLAAACVALAATASLGADAIRAYDFGPKDSAVWPGFKGVDTTPYAKAASLGWRSRGRLVLFSQRGPHPGFVGGLQDPLVVDGLRALSSHEAHFLVDLPNGKHTVWALTSFYRRSFANYLWGDHWIKAEGKYAFRQRIDKTNFFDIYLSDAKRIYNREVRERGVWKTYLQPWLDNWKRFDVTVRDGQLDLGFRLTGDRLHAVVIAPAAMKGQGEAFIEKLSRDREAWFSDRWKEDVPAVTTAPAPPADRAKGYTVFGRHWMDEVYPTSQPGPKDLNPTLKLMATPGEREPVAFCVRAHKDLKMIDVKVGDLVGPGGARIPASAFEQWLMRYETRPYPGGTYKVIPVTLEKRPPTDLDRDFTRMYFLKALIPANAPAGVYAGQVTVKPANAPATTIPIKIRVLPFKLAYPKDIGFCVEGGSPARFLRPGLNDPEIRAMWWQWVRWIHEDLRKHNMTTIHTNMIPAVTVKGDKVVMDFDGGGKPYHNLNRMMRLYKEVGLTGPAVIYQGFMGIICWGLRMHPARVKLEVFQSPRGRKLIAEAARQIVAHAKAKGWPVFILYATGEPTNFQHGVQKAIATFKAMGEVPGARRAMSSINERDHAAFPYLEVILFGSPSQNNMGEKVKAMGKDIWGYNSGITRLSYGFYVWRVGAKGRTQEHYQSTIQDRPFNDFLGTSSCWSYTHAAFGPEGVRPCPRLEHEAEGVDDYRYVLTLKQLIDKAKAKGGAAAERAKDSERLLQRIWKHVPDDMRVFYRRGGKWEPGIYERLRSRIAVEIMKLNGAMQ